MTAQTIADRETPPSTSPQSGGSPPKKRRSALREMSYADGEAALAPEAKAATAAEPATADAETPTLPRDIDPPPWVDNDIVSARCVHEPELLSIIRHLRGKTYDSDVDAVLGILSHWDVATIVGAWAAIGQLDPSGQWRDDILDNLAGSHVQRFPREVRGTLRAAPRSFCQQKLQDLDKDDPGEALYAHAILVEHPGLATPFAASHPDDVKAMTRALATQTKARDAIDGAIDQKKEAELAAEERNRRMQVVEEDRYTAGDKAKKEAVAGRIGRLEAELTGNWAGHMTSAQALKVFTIFKESLAADKAGVELRLLCRRAEATKYMDWWLENVPEATVYQYGENLRCFLHILRNRPPEAALRACEKLLSYGLFDWAVTDAEAILAYELIRAQPPSVQAQFREKDAGKWLARMEHNTKQEVLTETGPAKDGEVRYNAELDQKGEVTEGGFGTAGNAAENTRRDREEAAFAMDGGKDLFVELDALFARGVNAKTAQEGLERVAAIPSDDLRGAIARRLDAVGHIEALCAALGKELWREVNRGKVVALFVARDAMRSVAHIGALVGAVATNSDEARLAFELLRALPADYRNMIRERYPEWQGAIVGDMSRDERGASGTNFYDGGKDQADRKSLLAQLESERLWACDPKSDKDAAAVTHLEQVLRMAAAAGHRKLVFDTAQRFGKLDTFKTLLVSVKVIDDKGAYLEKEPVAGQPHDGLAAVGHGLDLLHELQWEDGEENGPQKAAPIDLVKAQDLLDIGGARFKAQDDAGKAKGVNRADLTLDPYEGELVANVPGGLDLEEFRGLYGDLSITTGPVKTGPLLVAAHWIGSKPRDGSKATKLMVDLHAVDLHDLMVATAGSMTAVKRIGIEHLHFELCDIPEGLASSQSGKDVSERVSRQISSDIFDWIGEVLESVVQGLPAQGLDQTRGPGGMSLHVKGLVLEGLAASSGAHAGEIRVDTIDVREDRLPSRKARARIDVLDTRLKEAREGRDATGRPELVATWQAERDALARQLPELDKDDKAYIALYEKQKAGQPFEGDEAERFAALQAKMGRAQVSATVDKVRATGFGTAAGQNDGTVDVDALSATGESNALGATFLANPIAALQSGQEAGADPKAGTTIAGDVRVGRIAATNVHAQRVPDYEAQRAEKRALEAQAVDALDDRSTARLAALQALWARPVKGPEATYGGVVEALLPLDLLGPALDKDHEKLAEHARLRALITEESLTIEAIEARGVGLEGRVNLGQGPDDAHPEAGGSVAGRAGASIDDLDVRNVRTGDGQGIDHVEAKGIAAGGDISLLWGEGTRDGALAGGHLDVAKARLSGIHTGKGQSEVGEVSLEGAHLEASTDALGDGREGSISVTAEKLRVSAVTTPSLIKRLEAERAELEAGIHGEPTEAQKKQLLAIKDQLADLQTLPLRAEMLAKDITALRQKRETAKKKSDRDALDQRIRVLEGKQRELLAQYEAASRDQSSGDAALSADAVGASVKGVGNFLSEDWSLDGKRLDVAVDITKKLAVDNLAFSSPTFDFAAKSLSVSGFHASVGVTLAKGEHGLEAQAPALSHLRLDRLDAERIDVKLPLANGELVELGIPKAFVQGLVIDTVPLDRGLDLGTFDGKLQVEKIQAAFTAKIADYFAAQGDLAITQKMSYERLGSGDVRFDPGNIDFQLGIEAGDKTPKGSVVEALRGLGGSVNIRGMRTPLVIHRDNGKLRSLKTDRARIGSIAVGGLHYVAGGTSLKLHDGVLDDVALDARMTFADDPAQQGGAPTVADFHIDRLAVRRIVGNDLHYDAPKLNIALKRGTLNRVTVTDLQPAQRSFKVALGDANTQPKGGKDGGSPAIDLEQLQIVQGALKVTTDAKVAGISVGFASDGSVTAAVDGVEAENIDVSLDDSVPEAKRGAKNGKAGVPEAKRIVKDGKAGVKSATASYDAREGFHGILHDASVSGDIDADNVGGAASASAGVVAIDASADGKSGAVTADDVSGETTLGPKGGPLDAGTTTFGGTEGREGGHVAMRWDEGGYTSDIDIPRVSNSGLHYSGMQGGDFVEVDLRQGKADLDGIKGNVVVLVPPGTEESERTIKLVLQLDVAQAAVTDGLVRFGGVELHMDHGSLNGLFADEMHVTMQQSAPDAKHKRKTTSDITNGTIGFGKDVQRGLDFDAIRAVIPQLLQGHGSLEAGKLVIGSLGSKTRTFTLSEITANPKIAASEEGWKLMNIETAGSARLKGLHGEHGPDGTHVHVDEGSADFAGVAKGGTSAAESETPPSSDYVDIQLEALDHFAGSAFVTLPLGSGLKFEAAMRDGKLGEFDVTAATPEVHLLLDAFSVALNRAVSIREMLEGTVEDKLAGGTDAHGPEDLQSKLLGIFTATGPAGAAIDALITGDIMRNLEESADLYGKRIVDSILQTDSAAKRQEVLDAERATRLRAFVDGIEIGLSGNGTGDISGAYKGTNFKGALSTDLYVHGTLAQGLGAALRAVIVGLEAHGPGYDVSVGETTVTADGIAKDGSGQQLEGGGNAKVKVRDVDVRSGPNPPRPR